MKPFLWARKYPVVKFASTSATLDPVIVSTGDIVWRWADGTESYAANPGSKDMSGTDGKHELVVRGWDTVTQLDFQSDELTSFEGLQYLTSLTYLHLRYNSLTEIGVVTNLTSLTYLSLGNNSLTEIGVVTNLINLTHLHLSGDSLTEIGVVTNLTNLTYLALGSNSLTDVGRLNTQHSLTSVYVQDSSFDALRVDRALCDVAESVAAHARVGTKNISGNVAPTDGSGTGFDGIQAVADLVAAGWAVTTD